MRLSSSQSASGSPSHLLLGTPSPSSFIGGGTQSTVPSSSSSGHVSLAAAIPAVVQILAGSREFILAGHRSPALVLAVLKQLPAHHRCALEDLSAGLMEVLLEVDAVAAAGHREDCSKTRHSNGGDQSSSDAPSSPQRFSLAAARTSTAITEQRRLKLLARVAESPTVAAWRAALMGAPSRAEPPEGLDHFPNPMAFGVAQGAYVPLQRFLAVPAHSKVLALLTAVLAGSSVLDVGSSGGGSMGHTPTTEALLFASTLWIQRYPADHAAVRTEQQRCRKAGVAFSLHEATRLWMDADRAERQRQHTIVMAAHADAHGGSGNGGTSNQHHQNAATVFFGSAADDASDDDDRAGSSYLEMERLAATHQQRRAQDVLERQMRLLLLSNLQLHHQASAPLWTTILAQKDECRIAIANELRLLQETLVRAQGFAALTAVPVVSSSGTSTATSATSGGASGFLSAASARGSNAQQKAHQAFSSGIHRMNMFFSPKKEPQGQQTNVPPAAVAPAATIPPQGENDVDDGVVDPSSPELAQKDEDATTIATTTSDLLPAPPPPVTTMTEFDTEQRVSITDLVRRVAVGAENAASALVVPHYTLGPEELYRLLVARLSPIAIDARLAVRNIEEQFSEYATSGESDARNAADDCAHTNKMKGGSVGGGIAPRAPGEDLDDLLNAPKKRWQLPLIGEAKVRFETRVCAARIRSHCQRLATTVTACLKACQQVDTLGEQTGGD